MEKWSIEDRRVREKEREKKGRMEDIEGERERKRGVRKDINRQK